MSLAVRAVPFLFVFAWSTGWIVAGFSARLADPLWFLFLRFSMAAAVIAGIAVVMGAPWPRSGREVGHAMMSGVLLHALYLAAVWWAVANAYPPASRGSWRGSSR